MNNLVEISEQLNKLNEFSEKIIYFLETDLIPILFGLFIACNFISLSIFKFYFWNRN